MKIIIKEEAILEKEKIIEDIKNGAVFIYPTDTIYGIGCDATNEESVKRIRDIKSKHKRPLSVIAPSKEWIIKNCVVPKEGNEWVKKLPGPYTLIFKLKNKKCISKEVNNNEDSLGVRIPDHWFTDFVKETNNAIVTTSANKAGKDFMTSIENLDPDIKNKVDFTIYEGEKHGKPSTLVNLTKEEVKVIKR